MKMATVQPKPRKSLHRGKQKKGVGNKTWKPRLTDMVSALINGGTSRKLRVLALNTYVLRHTYVEQR